MTSGYSTEQRDIEWFRHCVATEVAESGVVFNPLFGAVRRDPASSYERLRRQSPVHFSRLLDCWVVTRHADVDAVLRAHDVFRSDARSSAQELVNPFVLMDSDNPALFMVDPPDHSRLRAVLAAVVARAAVERALPRIESCIWEVVDRLGAPGEEIDLVERFASEVPVRTFEVLTGLSLPDVPAVSGWASAVVQALEPVATERTAAAAFSAYRELGAYLDERLALGGGPLADALSGAVRDGRVSEGEARQLLRFLVLAGIKTATDFLAGAVVRLAALRPGAPERALVDADRVETLLSELSPVQIVARTATRSVDVAGRLIGEGQRVLLVLGSANRDRGGGPNPRPDVAFGRGIHTCPGLHLARAQGRLALSRLFTTYPDLRLVRATPSRRCITLRSWDRVVVRL